RNAHDSAGPASAGHDRTPALHDPPGTDHDHDGTHAHRAGTRARHCARDDRAGRAHSGARSRTGTICAQRCAACAADDRARRRRAVEGQHEEDRGTLADALVPAQRVAPVAAPKPAAREPVAAAPEPAPLELTEPAPAEAAVRPWLELDIEPDRAANTDSEAS